MEEERERRVERTRKNEKERLMRGEKGSKLFIKEITRQEK